MSVSLSLTPLVKAKLSYLEAEDYGPNESKCEAVVSVDNVMRTHILQMNLLFLQELQSLVNILQTVNAHTALGGLWLNKRTRSKTNVINDIVVIITATQHLIYRRFIRDGCMDGWMHRMDAWMNVWMHA